MRMITRESDYGINALVWLARRKDRHASALELARELRIPGSFLRRILQRLGRQGMIRSRKGTGGGFELALNPKDIVVGEIVAALQGPIRLSDCDLRAAICARRRHCLLRRKLKTIEGRVVSELMGISIAALAEDADDGGGIREADHG